jgi:hypothetical protein
MNATPHPRLQRLLVLTTALLFACDAPGDNSNTSDGAIPDVTNDVTNDTFVPPDVTYPPSPILVAMGQFPLTQGIVVELGLHDDERVIRVVSADSTPVVITGVGWARGDSGLPENNPHVRLVPVAVPVPLATPQAEMTFTLRLASDYEDIDDASPSTLIITSELTDTFGTVKTHEFPLFVVISRSPAPVLQTTSMTFLHTPGTLRTDQTRLYQQRGDGWFHVTRYELESPSTEIVLSSESTTPLKIGPIPDNHLDVRVEFTPQSDTLVSNAILFYLDTQDTPLRLPITSVIPTEAYELTYSDPNQFDFRGITATTTRSVTFMNTGTLPLTLTQPRLTPAGAASDFQVRSFVPASDGGSDSELTSWPRGLAAGRSVRFDVTHTPRAGTPDAQLELVYTGGDPRSVVIPIPLISAKP